MTKNSGGVNQFFVNNFFIFIPLFVLIGDGSEYASSETDLDDEFIEQMLDENLPDDLKEKRKDAQYDEKYKIVLEGKFFLPPFYLLIFN